MDVTKLRTIIRSRKIALAVTVFVIVASTLFGVGRDALRISGEIEACFYGGVFVEDGGYLQPGIASQLDRCADAALGLASLLVDHSDLSGRA